LTACPTTLADSYVASHHGDQVVYAVCDEGQDEEEHDDDYCDDVVFLDHFDGLGGCVCEEVLVVGDVDLWRWRWGEGVVAVVVAVEGGFRWRGEMFCFRSIDRKCR